jgi:hypothetical protein
MWFKKTIVYNFIKKYFQKKKNMLVDRKNIIQIFTIIM